jgi:uncharacterized protein YggE
MNLGLLLFALVPEAFAQQPPTSDERSTIVVTGSGSISVPPDGVTIRLLVSSLEKRPDDAAERIDEGSDAVVAAIEALGIDGLAVSRVGYSVNPDWERRANGERKFRGYAGRVTIRVETGSLGATGQIIEAGIASGAGQVQGISYSSSQIDEARRQALAAAVEAARLDAQAMAAAAGGTLGRLILLTTERTEPPPGLRLEAITVETSRGATVRGGTEITPEDLTVSARVESRWLFSSESGSE